MPGTYPKKEYKNVYKNHSLQNITKGYLQKGCGFVLQQLLLHVKDYMDPTIFILIVLISIFEFFVDRPALKREGLIRDAKITTIFSIGWVVLAIVMSVMARMAR